MSFNTYKEFIKHLKKYIILILQIQIKSILDISTWLRKK